MCICVGGWVGEGGYVNVSVWVQSLRDCERWWCV